MDYNGLNRYKNMGIEIDFIIIKDRLYLNFIETEIEKPVYCINIHEDPVRKLYALLNV